MTRAFDSVAAYRAAIGQSSVTISGSFRMTIRNFAQRRGGR